MNPQITTLDPVATASNTKTILAKNGFDCALLTIAPGEEVAQLEVKTTDEQLLFVVEGEITVRAGAVNTILEQDKALLVPRNESHTLVAHSNRPAKILRVIIPPRQIVTPQILSFSR